ncbi:MAG: hypothetical protein AABZ84_05130 [Pseudomonadota bacterium]
MNRMKMSMLILSVAVCTACSQRGNPSAAEQASPVAEKKPSEPMWTQQTQALGRAKGMEASLLDSARQRDQALIRQSR